LPQGTIGRGTASSISQSALLLVVVASAIWWPLPGLVGVPASELWLAQRLVWFPVLTVLTLAFVVLSHRDGKPVARWPGGRP